LAKVDHTFLRGKFKKNCAWEHFGRERPYAGELQVLELQGSYFWGAFEMP